MTLLDELSGFEFEETMAHVFEKLGYTEVEVADVVADKGRDVIMLDHDGETAIIVECKHTDVVGRPVIQKLDSAVRTYDHDGPKRGMIATSGRLTAPASEYAEKIGVEVVDGRRIREIADEIGMDLYNGRIEIVCEQVLEPVHPEGPMTPLRSVIDEIGNLDWSDVPMPDTTVTLVPAVLAVTHTQRTFETGAGVIHRIDDEIVHVLDASRGGVEAFDREVQKLISENLDTAVTVDTDDLSMVFDTVNERRFGRTETEYRELIIDRAISQHTTTVTYTGDNNVTYERECEPSKNDVTLKQFKSVFVPRIFGSLELGDQPYEFDWYGAGDAFEVTDETFQTCRVCDDESTDTPLDVTTITGRLSKAVGESEFTYCDNCGRVACQAHIRTERLTGQPVCTGCSVSERFAGARRYFYDEANLEEFSQSFAEQSLTDRLKENTVGLASAAVVLLLLLVTLTGMIG